MSRMINKLPLNKNEFLVPVTWEMSGFVVVEAENAEEAYNKVINNPDDYPLPCNGEYVDASFGVSCDTAELIPIFTDSFNKGEMNILVDRDYKKVHE